MIPVSTVTFLYGVLAVVGLLVVVWFAVMFIVSRFSDQAYGGLESVRERLTPYALVGAFLVATLATLGSLYFSEIAHFEPCLMCWYQRIAMYPLVVILGIAAWRRDEGVRIYAIPVAAVGAAISTYHYFLEWFPDVLDTGACVIGTPCTLVWFREFGFVSIPFMALTAFALIITLLLIPDREQPVVQGPPSKTADDS